MSTQSFSLAIVLAIPFTLGCNANQIEGNPDGGSNPFCVGRQCHVKLDCPASMGPTTLTGVVSIPAGTLPLYNAKVYIPSGDPPATPTAGASCLTCDQIVPPDAVASAITDINGKFTLTNVPSGQNIPVVIRIGKWQRVATIPSVTDCTTTALDVNQTRLPRNQSEGNIPKIALSTGGADALECLLRKNKIGIDDAEFTNPDGNGRINLFAGGSPPSGGLTDSRGTNSYTPALGGQAFPTSGTWWNDPANKLNSYDMVLLSCEGYRNYPDKQSQAYKNIQNFLDLGGRVFASHWHNVWIDLNPGPISQAAHFTFDNTGADYKNDITAITATINQSAANGRALANWLQLPQVMGTTTLGQLPIYHSRITLTYRNPSLTTDWVDYQYTRDPNMSSLLDPTSQYFSFNTPIGVPAMNQCGQMVFTDMHVSGAAASDHTDSSAPALPFATGCNSAALSAQEKALIYLLFDLSNCLQTIVG